MRRPPAVLRIWLNWLDRRRAFQMAVEVRVNQICAGRDRSQAYAAALELVQARGQTFQQLRFSMAVFYAVSNRPIWTRRPPV